MLSDVAVDDFELRALAAVLEEGWLSMGPQVQAFEEAFAQMHGAAHAVAVSSGTAALHLALAAAGVGPGDEVIQPAINFVAAANMTRTLGAVPVFADITAVDRPLISPQAVQRALTPRTKALIAFHHGGYPADLAALKAIAAEHGLSLIEDACHAPATFVEGRALGTHGAAGCFSFFANKNITTAEGGMILTHSAELAGRMRLLRSHGMTATTWDRHQGHASAYDVEAIGFNYRMDELRAAIGRVQLTRLAGLQERRRSLTECYRRHLSAVPGVDVVLESYNGPHAAHLLAVLVPAGQRDRIVRACRQGGIQTSLHYPCISDFTAYRGAARCELPISREFAQRAITLPLHAGLAQAEVEAVCTVIEQALAGTSGRRPKSVARRMEQERALC